MRKDICVRNANENNLRGVNVDLPRDQLIVLTGLSGSGKSSLAFETIYAEGQRRFLESLSVYARRFAQQLKKPNVESVTGLSPVISIEQKSVSKNPRSTVGTMTDLYDYLRLLYAASASANCPRCKCSVPTRSVPQIAEHVLGLPSGTAVEICAPVFKVYGEDYPFLLSVVRTAGCRTLRVNDVLVDITGKSELQEGTDYTMDAVVDRFVVKPEIAKNLAAAIERALELGEGFLRLRIDDSLPVALGRAFFSDFACPTHHVLMGEVSSDYYSFNLGSSFCPTCLGLGTYLKVHPSLLTPDDTRSIAGGAFIGAAFEYDRNKWSGRLMYSLSKHLGFSLETPYRELPASTRDVILHGSGTVRFPLVVPPGATKGDEHAGKLFRYDGIITEIERRYRQYRRQKVANSWMEEYLKNVMVEQVCPDCAGTRLRSQRLLTSLAGRNIHEMCELSLSELRGALDAAIPLHRQPHAGEHIVQEMLARLDLLLGIGVHYLTLSRRAGTLSGGESQRIRLSVQIGSGLMGMLYVLDEPSIGLHARDNQKMIRTLRHLRDIGNTVMVVEHDEETIRAADYIVEMGPGPGVHGGQVVAAGPRDEVLSGQASLTAQYLCGARTISRPDKRRPVTEHHLVIRGAEENNLQRIDVRIPLGLFVCVTGVSGSGKSTLVNEILYKRLRAQFHDSRVLSGLHRGIDGLENVRDVIMIDQSPIGRTPTSSPATYIGAYDTVRHLFAATTSSRDRGYTASRYSFNVKGGRCEECLGRGIVITSLHFLPDVETECATCGGKRYNEETLEITYRGKSIADVLSMSIEEAVCFFDSGSLVSHKLRVLNELGMGYLQLGQSSTTLSGGEAQRVKLAHELSKVKRGARNIYILDEPTTGLHLADIQRLLESLNRLVDAGNSVLVIEHHLDVIKNADWIIDLGPEGGKDGGRVIAEGTPEEVACCAESFTGQFLAPHIQREAALAS